MMLTWCHQAIHRYRRGSIGGVLLGLLLSILPSVFYATTVGAVMGIGKGEEFFGPAGALLGGALGFGLNGVGILVLGVAVGVAVGMGTEWLFKSRRKTTCQFCVVTLIIMTSIPMWYFGWTEGIGLAFRRIQDPHWLILMLMPVFSLSIYVSVWCGICIIIGITIGAIPDWMARKARHAQ